MSRIDKIRLAIIILAGVVGLTVDFAWPVSTPEQRYDAALIERKYPVGMGTSFLYFPEPCEHENIHTVCSDCGETFDGGVVTILSIDYVKENQ